MFRTFLDDLDDEVPDVLGNDELLIKWARGVEMFTTKKMQGMFGPAILKKFDVVRGEEFLPRFAELWQVDLATARAKVFS